MKNGSKIPRRTSRTVIRIIIVISSAYPEIHPQHGQCCGWSHGVAGEQSNRMLIQKLSFNVDTNGCHTYIRFNQYAQK